MSKPRVAILIPVFNGARYLAQSIQSVLRQSLADLELIVWDDGSTDGSADVARAAIGDDPRGRIAGGAAQRGQAAAFNSAARLATAPLVGGLDSDDWLAPTALEETVGFLDLHSDADVVYTDHYVISPAGQVMGLGERCRVPYSPERLLVDFMTFHLRLIRRPAFERVGGVDETYPSATDYDFCLRLSECCQIEHLARPLYYYRRHVGAIGLSRRVQQIEQSARAIRAALKRRGLAGELALDVELVGLFNLRPLDPGEQPVSE
jgi:glycosyltransferase involved in cell wall biosynthesis